MAVAIELMQGIIYSKQLKKKQRLLIFFVFFFQPNTNCFVYLSFSFTVSLTHTHMLVVVPSAYFMLVLRLEAEVLTFLVVRKAPLTVMNAHHVVFTDTVLAVKGTNDFANDGLLVFVLGAERLHIYRVTPSTLTTFRYKLTGKGRNTCDSIGVWPSETSNTLTVWLGSSRDDVLRSLSLLYDTTTIGLVDSDERKLGSTITALACSGGTLYVGLESGGVTSLSAAFDKHSGLETLFKVPRKFERAVKAVTVAEGVLVVLYSDRIVTVTGETLLLCDDVRRAIKQSVSCELNYIDGTFFIGADMSLFEIHKDIIVQHVAMLHVGLEEPWVVTCNECVVPLTEITQKEKYKGEHVYGLAFFPFASLCMIGLKLGPCIAEGVLYQSSTSLGTDKGLFFLSGLPDNTITLSSLNVSDNRCVGVNIPLDAQPSPYSLLRASIYGPVVITNSGYVRCGDKIINVKGKEYNNSSNKGRRKRERRTENPEEYIIPSLKYAEVYKSHLLCIWDENAYLIDLNEDNNDDVVEVDDGDANIGIPLIPFVLCDHILLACENKIKSITEKGETYEVVVETKGTPLCGSYSQDVVWLGTNYEGNFYIVALLLSGYGSVGPLSLSNQLGSSPRRIIAASEKSCYILTEQGNVWVCTISPNRNKLKLYVAEGLTRVTSIDPCISSEYVATAITQSGVSFLMYAPETVKPSVTTNTFSNAVLESCADIPHSLLSELPMFVSVSDSIIIDAYTTADQNGNIALHAEVRSVVHVGETRSHYLLECYSNIKQKLKEQHVPLGALEHSKDQVSELMRMVRKQRQKITSHQIEEVGLRIELKSALETIREKVDTLALVSSRDKIAVENWCEKEEKEISQLRKTIEEVDSLVEWLIQKKLVSTRKKIPDKKEDRRKIVLKQVLDDLKEIKNNPSSKYSRSKTASQEPYIDEQDKYIMSLFQQVAEIETRNVLEEDIARHSYAIDRIQTNIESLLAALEVERTVEDSNGRGFGDSFVEVLKQVSDGYR